MSSPSVCAAFFTGPGEDWIGSRFLFELRNPFGNIHIHPCLNCLSVRQNHSLRSITSLPLYFVRVPRQIDQGIGLWFIVGLVDDRVWVTAQRQRESVPTLKYVL